MLEKEKSQVTLFMVLGIVLLFAAILVFTLAKDVKVRIEEHQQYPVKNYVQDCLKLVGDKAVERVLIQGGNYQIGTILENPKVYKLAKPIGDGQGMQRNLNFSKDSIDIGIKSFFADTFAACINDFRDFNVPINFTDIAMINVTVGDDAIVMDLDFPVSVKDANKEYSLNKFSYKKDIEIAKIIDTVNQIVNKSIELNDDPTDLLKGLAEKKEISLRITLLDENGTTNNIVYILGFNNDRNIVAFVINYDWSNKKTYT